MMCGNLRPLGDEQDLEELLALSLITRGYTFAEVENIAAGSADSETGGN